MPAIRSSADLRNSYNEISTFCRACGETAFITQNGKGNLVVMSIEHYVQLEARHRLYGDILAGLADAKRGQYPPLFHRNGRPPEAQRKMSCRIHIAKSAEHNISDEEQKATVVRFLHARRDRVAILKCDFPIEYPPGSLPDAMSSA